MYPEQYIACGMFFWLMVWRFLNRHRRGMDARMMAILAIAACIFTAGLEAGWGRAYYGYEQIGTLANNFSLVLGVSPAWKVLIFGLLITLAATWHTLHTRQAAT